MATITRFYGPTDYIELQDEHIKKLSAELTEMRQAIEDASEGSLRGSTIRFFARIVRERDEALNWEKSHLERIDSLERRLKFAVHQRDEARRIIRDIAVHAGKSWTDSQMGPPTQFRIHERYILPAIEFVKETKMESDTLANLRAERDEARTVACRLLNDPVYRLRCIDRRWRKEGYADPFDADFEHAMELKNKLP